MTYRGHIEKGAVVLDEPAALPEGAAVIVELQPQTVSAAAQRLVQLAGLFPAEDLKEIEATVNSCRTVDADGW